MIYRWSELNLRIDSNLNSIQIESFDQKIQIKMKTDLISKFETSTALQTDYSKLWLARSPPIGSPKGERWCSICQVYIE